MTQQDPSLPDPVIELVSRCQEAHANWMAAEEPEQKNAMSETYRLLLEDLWTLLAGDLRLITRGWMRSNMAPDTESLALNMFGNIVFSLPKLLIDPQRNVRNLLLTIARRGLIDEYRRSRPSSSQRQAARTTSMDSQAHLIDPKSTHIEDRTVQRLDGEALLKAVWKYWLENLIEVEYKIMMLRWRTDPPCPFGDIAVELGPGWEEATVRQRHHRIMNKTREYLRKNGLID
jgi:DNA-directed RNA polymerase specialized sigma24 family protein